MYRAKTTIEQWRILQAVVDFGGYAQAATQLNKSQSSLNHAVTKLQDQLGVALLEVIGRKAYLTEAGEVMLRRARHLTQNIQDLEELATNINQNWEPEITVAADLAYPREYLYAALKAFQPHSRGSRLKIINTVLTGTEEAITEKWADLVIAGSIPKGFLGEPLCQEYFYAVCHPQHELAQLNSPVEPSELAQHLQLVIKDSSRSPQEKQGWLKSEQRWTVSDFNAAIDIMCQGIGFCWLPEYTLQEAFKQQKLHKLNIKGSSFRAISFYLIAPKADKIGPGTELLYQQILALRQCNAHQQKANLQVTST
ncbi:LysR family transcriptional regulator [Paraglaciecola hydrolytica]|uniref:LysR family transcriptional regulator n=1 Tax=Paraglaciecola hydrolytica TaxID=1799789 RepID=A0A136A5Z0_9ALTE|nr:LysR family transcriptional regulator [Paraglaciecola hydrolytica]KXI30636.1 LysR family transcriptional regulator [Paraglaciecola hydrolytica]